MRYAIGLLAGLWVAAVVFTVAMTGAYVGPPQMEVALSNGGPAGPCLDHNPASTKEVDLGAPPRRPPAQTLVVELDTSCGPIELTLDGAAAPRSVASFERLANADAFDNSGLFRWGRGVLRAGDPNNFERRSRQGPGYRIFEPAAVANRYPRGTVAMLSEPGKPPGSSGSQFFIVVGGGTGLEPHHAVIGEVSGGFDTLETIEGVIRDRPVMIFDALVQR